MNFKQALDYISGINNLSSSLPLLKDTLLNKTHNIFLWPNNIWDHILSWILDIVISPNFKGCVIVVIGISRLEGLQIKMNPLGDSGIITVMFVEIKLD